MYADPSLLLEGKKKQIQKKKKNLQDSFFSLRTTSLQFSYILGVDICSVCEAGVYSMRV